jgi:hypothetical protein
MMAVQDVLEPTVFDRAFEAGRQFDVEQAVNLAVSG